MRMLVEALGDPGGEKKSGKGCIVGQHRLWLGVKRPSGSWERVAAPSDQRPPIRKLSSRLLD